MTIALPRQKQHSDWLARLRTIMVLRPGQRVVNVPGIGVSASRRAVASGAVSWWLAGGVSGCVAAYDSVAASKAASAVNLANPGTYDMVEAGTVGWSSGAWSGFSNANYFNTGVTPASGYSMIVQFAGGSGTAWSEIAGSAGTSSTRFRLAPIYALDATKRGYHYGATNQAGGARAYSGIMCLTPGQGYYNGDADHAAFSPSWSGTPVAIFVGTYNNNGTPSNAVWNGSIQRLAIYSGNVAAFQAAIYAAMAAL